MMNENILPPQGRLTNKIFEFPVRIYYEDTDAGGIVYYANYLKFAERTRSEYLRYLDVFTQQKVLEEEKCGFVVRHVEIDYRQPAVLDDFLVCTCQILECSGAGMVMYQEIRRGDAVLATIKVQLVYLNIVRKRPLRIPPEIKEKITQLC